MLMILLKLLELTIKYLVRPKLYIIVRRTILAYKRSQVEKCFKSLIYNIIDYSGVQTPTNVRLKYVTVNSILLSKID